jgi:hypothetical protein
MASSSLAPYYDNTNQTTFVLSTQGADETNYKVAGRSIARPYSVTVRRKTTALGAAGNDHVIVRIARVESNADTGKPVTGQVTLDISVPKDSATIDGNDIGDLCALMSSLLNDNTAMAAASSDSISALVQGNDI